MARWTLWVAVAACGACVFEALVLHGKAPIERIAARPRSFARQVLGLPHDVIATYLLLTSARLRSAAGWLRLGRLVVAGVALCCGFAALGGTAGAALPGALRGRLLAAPVGAGRLISVLSR
ncbi:MAG: hypothetical protein ACYTDU_04985 [Planctomycetota bacterium]